MIKVPHFTEFRSQQQKNCNCYPWQRQRWDDDYRPENDHQESLVESGTTEAGGQVRSGKPAAQQIRSTVQKWEERTGGGNFDAAEKAIWSAP